MATRKETEAPAPAQPAEPEPELPPVTARTRRPLGSPVRRLDNTPPPRGMYARWINDVNDGLRLQNARDAGYIHMKDDNGAPIRKAVGTAPMGGPLYAYRMMIPLEFWEADRAQYEEARRDVEAEMMRGKTATLGDSLYLPDRGTGKSINKIERTAGRYRPE